MFVKFCRLLQKTEPDHMNTSTKESHKGLSLKTEKIAINGLKIPSVSQSKSLQVTDIKFYFDLAMLSS